MKKSCLLLSAIVVASLAQAASAANVYVFLLAGQSNAYGQPAFAGDNPAVLPSDSSVMFFNGYAGSSAGMTPTGTWGTLASRYSNIVGPEVGLGRSLQAAMPGQQIAIVKYAVGGTQILEWERQDHNPYYNPASAIYPKFIAAVQSCEASIIAQGNTPVLCGFAWFQGENGATNNYDATVWASNHNDPYAWQFRDQTMQFLTDMRSDLGAPNLPVMETRISDLFYDPGFLSATAQDQNYTVAQVTACVDHRRREQEAVDTNLANTSLVSADGMTFYPNQGSDKATWFHFMPSNYITLGNRMATAYLTATPEPATLVLLGIGGGMLLARRKRA